MAIKQKVDAPNLQLMLDEVGEDQLGDEKSRLDYQTVFALVAPAKAGQAHVKKALARTRVATDKDTLAYSLRYQEQGQILRKEAASWTLKCVSTCQLATELKRCEENLDKLSPSGDLEGWARLADAVRKFKQEAIGDEQFSQREASLFRVDSAIAVSYKHHSTELASHANENMRKLVTQDGEIVQDTSVLAEGQGFFSGQFVKQLESVLGLWCDPSNLDSQRNLMEGIFDSQTSLPRAPNLELARR